MLAITFLTHQNGELLFSTIKEFLLNTNLDINGGVEVHILAQKCCKAYIKSLETLCKACDKSGVKFILHTNDQNLGVSKANNFLYNITKHAELVLHIEDDWVFHPSQVVSKNWLRVCVDYLSNSDVSTLFLRRYGSEEEKHKYGWTRHIPYVCHTHPNNFNFITKLETPMSFLFDEKEELIFTGIKDFLFTFNPCIRKNSDYEKCGVYPLPEFEDMDTKELFSEDGTKLHESSVWGWCEALTMEKTIGLKTKWVNDGLFVHFDDWVLELQKCKKSKFMNCYSNIVNVNCHFPILVIHTGLGKNIQSHLSHEFIYPLHYYLNTDDLQELNKIISKYDPRAIISFGEMNHELNFILQKIPFEYRKKWIHYSTYEELNGLQQIEHCMFKALFNHPYENSNPVVSVITPTYESKHRILRPYHSLLSQTYTNWEWIIIDDSKTDDTWNKLKTFAENDFRIKVYRRPQNDGSIGKNKHFCGSLASGKYVFELDHDDDILPTTFERLVEAGSKYPDAGFFYSDFIECFEDTYQPWSYGDYFGLGYASYYRKWYKGYFQYVCNTPRINPSTIRHIVGVPNHFRAWTREAYEDVKRHSTHLQVADDYDLILRTMCKYRWVHIPEMLYIQYRNQGGDNFTFHRNALIQYLVGKLRNLYEPMIQTRFNSLNVVDDIGFGNPQAPRDWTVNSFKYPILEYVYRKEDTEETPLVSIIIPTYNRPEHLKRALESVFYQTYKNFEVLLVGDKCPILDQFVLGYDKARDPRFKYYNLLTNGGPGGHLPRNYALKMMCNTKWVAYLDDDNYWLPNHLESLVNKVRENKELEFVFGSMVIDNKPLIFEVPRKGRIDTSVVMHRFDLCVKNNVLWKDRIQGGYAHDYQFFLEVTNNFSCKWEATLTPTLIYNTEFNGQSYEQLMTM